MVTRASVGAGAGAVTASVAVVLVAVLCGVVAGARHAAPGWPHGAVFDYGRQVSGGIAPLDPRFVRQALGELSGVPGDAVASGTDRRPGVLGSPLRSTERVTVTHPLTNDQRRHAYVIAALPFTAHTDSSGAARDESDPGDCGGLGGTVWYRFTAPEDMPLVAHTYGTRPAVALGVFHDAGSLERVGCDSDAGGSAVVAFAAERGADYLFQVSFPLGGGPLAFHLERNGTLELISTGTGSPHANDDSHTSSASADGRFVAFQSRATNLVPGVDATPCTAKDPLWSSSQNTESACAQIYVRDTRSGAVEIVSVSETGAPGNSESSQPYISADGRYVVFDSGATNLASGDAHAATQEVFIHDRRSRRTEMVGPAGGPDANHRGNPSVSADGRYVAFQSGVALAAEDINGVTDVYVLDRRTGRHELVTVDSQERPAQPAPHAPYDPRPGVVLGVFATVRDLSPNISGDGRHVVFRSDAANLVDGDTNNEWDTFVRDRLTGTTERVSVSSTGAQAENGWSFYNFKSNAVISSDGRYVAFASTASNLVAGDDDGLVDVFVRDRHTGTTVSPSARLAVPGTTAAFPTLSGDGWRVVFEVAPVALDGDVHEAQSDVYLYDMATGAATPVTVTPNGSDSHGWVSAIAADGGSVVFESSDPNLSRDPAGRQHVWIYRLPSYR